MVIYLMVVCYVFRWGQKLAAAATLSANFAMPHLKVDPCIQLEFQYLLVTSAMYCPLQEHRAKNTFHASLNTELTAYD